jgi:hypothetical protein
MEYRVKKFRRNNGSEDGDASMKVDLPQPKNVTADPVAEFLGRKEKPRILPGCSCFTQL